MSDTGRPSGPHTPFAAFGFTEVTAEQVPPGSAVLMPEPVHPDRQDPAREYVYGMPVDGIAAIRTQEDRTVANPTADAPTSGLELTDAQRDQIVAWFTSALPTGADAAKAAADAGAELDRIDQALRDAGIEYPLGARGVRDLANQRDGADEARDEALAKLRRYKDGAEAADGEQMTAHQLARKLLEGPDWPVEVQASWDSVTDVARYLGKVAILVEGEEPVDIPDVW
ncbi:hypothetical protein [Nocardiopsis sp. YSL2]|uniref:hypothetical protein n=1 Tax=Nocardiopsis sp. YSL2 TaxID=2939492 RepID=UPI0026F472E0|nr:hypothetical protein [Nocardiopsis sp. YSL2]